jgi:5-methylcytosine-specific restriction endonuclease McrA
MKTPDQKIVETTRRVIVRKIEHRPVRLPDASLTSPKLTPRKMSAEGRCRKCGKEGHLTRHHLVPESWFLGQPMVLRQIRNAHANIVPLCRPCHDEVDSKFPLVREGARRMLRSTFSQQEIAFVIAIRSRRWLEENYPLDIRS